MVRHAKKPSPVLQIAMWVVSPLVIAVLAGYLLFGEDAIERDRVTMCPTDSRHIGTYTVMILDRTEPLNDVQKAGVMNVLAHALKNTEPFERVSVYEIVGRESVRLDPLLMLCNPRRPRSGSSTEFDRDEALETKEFQERFYNKFRGLLESKLDMPPQQDSPIMEMIQAVNTKDLGAASEKGRRRLLLISDMMQHGPDYSHYRTPPREEFFNTSFYRRVLTDLSRVTVEVYYVNRTGGISEQPSGHKEFWKSYFERMKAFPVAIATIHGAGWQGMRMEKKRER